MDNEKELIEPRVRLFGEEVGRHPERLKKHDKGIRCSGKDRGIGLGIIIVSAGFILLFNNMGLVSWEFWHHVWHFWPFLVILAGVHIVFGNNWFSEIVSAILVLAFLFFVVSYGLVMTESRLAGYLPGGVASFIESFEFKNNSKSIWLEY